MHDLDHSTQWTIKLIITYSTPGSERNQCTWGHQRRYVTQGKKAYIAVTWTVRRDLMSYIPVITNILQKMELSTDSVKTIINDQLSIAWQSYFLCFTCQSKDFMICAIQNLQVGPKNDSTSFSFVILPSCGLCMFFLVYSYIHVNTIV